MNNIIFGNIYCAMIKCYPNYVKVGCTSNIDERMKNLSGQLVDKFICIFYIKVEYSQMFDIEKKIHKEIIDAGYKRINNKEFFKCKPNDIKYIFNKYKNDCINSNNYKKINTTKIKKKINTKKIINENENENIKMDYIYNCDDCKYSTNINSNWNRHIKSNSHIKTTTEKNVIDTDKTQFDSAIRFIQKQNESLERELNDYKQKYENIIEKNDDFHKDIDLETLNNKKVNKMINENENENIKMDYI
jgi:hypothetical protein